MAVLRNAKHEHFCQLVATGISPGDAYKQAGYGGRGAEASASRLLKNAKVSARISELRQEVAAETLKVAVTDRNYRLKLLQDTVDRINKVIEARAEDMKEIPGGDSGALMRDFRGKDSTPIYPVDHHMFLLRNETLERVAIETGEWKKKVEHTGKDGEAIVVKRIIGVADEEA